MGAPISVRGLPGMPIDIDADEDGPSRRGKSRKFSDQPRRPWWRPASTMGRVLLTLGAMVVVFVFAVSALALRSFLEHDARFRIAGTSNIQAAGLAEVSRSEMLPVFGEDIGRNIFFVPLNERRKQLEQIPWVERASVMRLLPDQIRVSVVERKPVAFLRQGCADRPGRQQWSSADHAGSHDGPASLLVSRGHRHRRPRPDGLASSADGCLSAPVRRTR